MRSTWLGIIGPLIIQIFQWIWRREWRLGSIWPSPHFWLLRQRKTTSQQWRETLNFPWRTQHTWHNSPRKLSSSNDCRTARTLCSKVARPGQSKDFGLGWKFRLSWTRLECTSVSLSSLKDSPRLDGEVFNQPRSNRFDQIFVLRMSHGSTSKLRYSSAWPRVNPCRFDSPAVSRLALHWHRTTLEKQFCAR